MPEPRGRAASCVALLVLNGYIIFAEALPQSAPALEQKHPHQALHTVRVFNNAVRDALQGVARWVDMLPSSVGAQTSDGLHVLTEGAVTKAHFMLALLEMAAAEKLTYFNLLVIRANTSRARESVLQRRRRVHTQQLRCICYSEIHQPLPPRGRWPLSPLPKRGSTLAIHGSLGPRVVHFEYNGASRRNCQLDGPEPRLPTIHDDIATGGESPCGRERPAIHAASCRGAGVSATRETRRNGAVLVRPWNSPR
jgi:hypothetical protein